MGVSSLPGVKRQYPNAGVGGVDGDQRSGSQFLGHLDQSSEDWRRDRRGAQVSGSDLYDAGTGPVGGREDRPEVQVVRDDDVAVSVRVGHDFGIGGCRGPDLGPVVGNMAC